jgi:hypothetical protein
MGINIAGAARPAFSVIAGLAKNAAGSPQMQKGQSASMQIGSQMIASLLKMLHGAGAKGDQGEQSVGSDTQGVGSGAKKPNLMDLMTGLGSGFVKR